MTLYSFKERCTDKDYVLLDSIVQDLGPMVWAHAVPKEMGVVQVAWSPAPKGLNNLIPEMAHCGCQPIFIPLVIAEAGILKHPSILHHCTLLCGQLLVCVMVDLMVVCLQDMRSGGNTCECSDGSTNRL